MIQRTSKKQGHMYLRVAQRTQKVPRTRLFHHESCVGIHFGDCFTSRLLVDTRIPNPQIIYNNSKGSWIFLPDENVGLWKTEIYFEIKFHPLFQILPHMNLHLKATFPRNRRPC